jgi:hypothetical protein
LDVLEIGFNRIIKYCLEYCRVEGLWGKGRQKKEWEFF